MRTIRRKMMTKWDMSYLLGNVLRFSILVDDTNKDLIENWDVSRVTNLSYTFQGCNKLSSLDLSGWDVSRVKDLTYAFNCDSPNIDIHGWKTSSELTNLYCTFYNAKNVVKLDLSGFDTSNVVNVAWCFEGASSLESLDISSFDLSKVQSYTSMFGRNAKLRHLLLGEGFGKIKGNVSIDMSSFASLDEESRLSFMSLYDRKANGLSDMALKLKSSYGFTEEQVEELKNKGYDINFI